MIIKFNSEELAELLRHDSGPFGLRSFESFMAEVCARTNDAGEVDLDRDDREMIETYSRRGHKSVLDKVFKRPLEKELKKFFGRRWNSRTRAPRRRP